MGRIALKPSLRARRTIAALVVSAATATLLAGSSFASREVKPQP
jgi:hypothetical protein